MSISYALLERCGFEPEGYFDKDDFQAIYTFSTPDAGYALGGATSDISREVLRKIETNLKQMRKVKELNTEYSALLSQKKAAYPAYRKARDEMQELMKAQKNVEMFFAEEKTAKEKTQTR